MTQKQSKEMAQLAYKALDDKKARDIRILDISEISVLADYFLIASGSNKNQVQAMVDNVQEEIGRIEEEESSSQKDAVMRQMFGGAADGQHDVLEEPGSRAEEA